MPEIPDVIQGEPVESAWGNTIRSRTTMRYADLADLQASEPVPEVGALRWVDAPGELVVWDGTAWLTVLDQAGDYTIGPGLVDIERSSSGMLRATRLGATPGTVSRFVLQLSNGLLIDVSEADGANNTRVAEANGSYWLTPGPVLPRHSAFTAPADAQAPNPADLGAVVRGGYASNDPVVGNSSRIYVTGANSGVIRTGEIVLAKNGGNAWYRGITADGPDWGDWYLLQSSLVPTAQALMTRLASAATRADVSTQEADAVLPAITDHTDSETGVANDASDRLDTAALLSHLLDRLEAIEARLAILEGT